MAPPPALPRLRRALLSSGRGMLAAGAVWAVLGGGGVARAGPVVREELQVRVDGIAERWRLEWRAPPVLACFESEVVTCPCEGFAQGEAGELELVRSRPDTPEERLPLTPLFDYEGSGPSKPPAMLRGWVMSKRDWYLPESQWARAVKGRARVRAMVLGDYDHDGQAREFVLLTHADGCGMRAAVLVGVDPRDGRLRARGTSEHPEHPLLLEPETWAGLRSSARVTRVETPCGDHGSDLEEVLRVHADASGLHATRELYACTPELTRGALTSREVL